MKPQEKKPPIVLVIIWLVSSLFMAGIMGLMTWIKHNSAAQTKSPTFSFGADSSSPDPAEPGRQEPAEDRIAVQKLHDKNDAEDKGGQYYAQKRYDKATSEYTKALKLDPMDAIAHGGLGRVYYAQQLYAKATVEFQQSLKLDPNNANDHINLGSAYYAQGLDDKAIAENKQALLMDPNNATAHNSLGVVYCSQKLYDHAIAEYQQALEIDPDDSNIHYDLGYAYFQTKRYGQASDEFMKALEIDPHNAQALHYQKLLNHKTKSDSLDLFTGKGSLQSGN